MRWNLSPRQQQAVREMLKDAKPVVVGRPTTKPRRYVLDVAWAIVVLGAAAILLWVLIIPFVRSGP